jgi:Family of unknown function (DUF6220)
MVETSRASGDADPVTAGRSNPDDLAMARAVRAIGPARLAFVAAAWLFVGCVVVQVFLVGLDVFAHQGPEIHRNFAYVYGWLAPLLVLIGDAARMPTRTRSLALVVLLLFAAQTVLPSLKADFPAFAAFHTVNALIIFGLSITVARQATTVAQGALDAGRP